MKNKKILQSLKENEKQLEKIVLESLKTTKNEVQTEFYNLWKEHNANNYIQDMFDDLQNNIEKFWLNEKYNKDITQSFNMLYFEHSGLYGGEFEAFAIDFNHINNDLPNFEKNKDDLKYLDNISSFPAFIIPLLYDLTREIQGKEDDFDDWDDLMDIYNLFETTAYIESQQTFLKAEKENLFKELNLKKPFYIAVGEHDSGSPNLLYVIE